MDPRSDAIAREAARLIQIGRAADINEALQRAADALGYPHARLPGHGRVRKHAQAMTMQAIGEEAYEELRMKVWQIAEQIMTVFEHTMPEVESMLVGRAAAGQIDAGVTIHIRLYTRHSDRDLAHALIDFGYNDPTFQAIDTRFGRLQQIRLTEEGHDIALTRVLPDLASQSRADMVSGKPIETLSLGALRRMIDERGR